MAVDIFRVIGKTSKDLLASGYTPTGVSSALKRIGYALGVDRVYVFENVKDTTGELCCSQRYEWSATSVEAQIDNPELQMIPYRAVLPAWVEPLSHDRPFYGLVRDMDAATQDILLPQEIISILICPITISGQWWGFVGFDDCHTPREWHHKEIHVLSLLARSLAGALRHGQMKQTLEAARAQLRDVVTFCSRNAT